MTIAILSDIHGNLPALEAVIADAETRGAAAFVNLGDLVSGPLWPRDTAALLMRLGWPTIAGNQERQLLSDDVAVMGASDRFARAELTDGQLAWLAGLPGTLAYSPDVFLCHGTPASDVAYLLEDVGPDGAYPASPAAVAARIGGRGRAGRAVRPLHRARLLWLGDARIVANPGSVGLPAYADERPYWHVMEAGSPRARYALLEGRTIDLIEVDYDFATAAAKRGRKGEDDWAFALRTGRAR